MRVLSEARRIAVKRFSLKAGYVKYHHGIKFTRFYFAGGFRFKVDNSGKVKARYKNLTRVDSIPNLA